MRGSSGPVFLDLLWRTSGSGVRFRGWDSAFQYGPICSISNVGAWIVAHGMVPCAIVTYTSSMS